MKMRAALLLSAVVMASAEVPPLSCPFSSLWLKHGPEKAARILGLKDPHMRRLADGASVQTGYGSCTYKNPFSGGEACIQLSGDKWTKEAAEKKCANPMPGQNAKGTLNPNGRCAMLSDSEKLAGTCLQEPTPGMVEEAPMALGGPMMGTCKEVSDGCTQWSGGTFKKLAACAEGEKAPAKKDGSAVETGFGSCTYKNPFSGGEACIQLAGTKEAVEKKCANPMPGQNAKGTLNPGERCAMLADSEKLAGVCMQEHPDGLVERAPMALGGPMMGTCKEVSDGCTQWSGGTFEKLAACAEGEKKGGAAAGAAGASTEVPATARCGLAPGPIGGAHMFGASPGYDVDCEGAPAAGSIWQWPLRWQAKYESESMPADPKRKKSKSTGTIYYDLSKNYKRQDMVELLAGELPAAGMGERRKTIRSTVLHRGAYMAFIQTFEDAPDKPECTYMDLGPIGNVRPDWYMDDRGASSGAQFLGNEHVYYRGNVTLVKKWRKKDFSNQYFTVSMLAEPEIPGPRWPLILNIPGEGFGDDSMRMHWDFKLREKDDDADFFIDEKYDCKPHAGRPTSEDGETVETDGPPTEALGMTEIPSNLNVRDAAWAEFMWTGGKGTPATPGEVVEAAMKASSTCDDGEERSEGPQGKIVLDKGAGTVKYCKDGDVVRLEAEFPAPEGPVWAAIGFRPHEDIRPEYCAMNPADVVLSEMGEGGEMSVGFGPLPQKLKQFEVDLDAAQELRDGLKTTENLEDFEEMETSYVDGKVKINFARNLNVARLRQLAQKEEEEEEEHEHRMLADGSGKYVCSVCGYVYDPEKHKGKSFDEQPDDWRCPRCRSPKEKFALGEDFKVKPEIGDVAMTFALGDSPKVSYHMKRGCFELHDMPDCAAVGMEGSKAGKAEDQCPKCPVCRTALKGEDDMEDKQVADAAHVAARAWGASFMIAASLAGLL